MNPGVIDQQGRESLKEILISWFADSKYKVEVVSNKDQYAEIGVSHNEVYLTGLVIDDYDDLFIDETQQTIDYADPEFFLKLYKILEKINVARCN